jgi:phosphoglucomutase
MDKNYLANFIQSIFDCLEETEKVGKVLVVSGDGRYFNKEAIQQIIRIAAANGLRKIVIGENGLVSTPAVSAIIRHLNALKSTTFSYPIFENSKTRRRVCGWHYFNCKP